jgi:hypothetical protein
MKRKVESWTRRHHWTSDELIVLKREAEVGNSPQYIANKLLGLSTTQISSKISSMRKKGQISTLTKEVSVDKKEGTLLTFSAPVFNPQLFQF